MLLVYTLFLFYKKIKWYKARKQYKKTNKLQLGGDVGIKEWNVRRMGYKGFCLGWMAVWVEKGDKLKGRQMVNYVKAVDKGKDQNIRIK